MDKFDIVNRAGQGAYGVVLRARTKQTGKTVAIKKMNVTTRDRLPILRELCTLRNMNHPRILSLIDVFCSRDTLSLVTEFVPYHLNDVIVDQQRPRDESFIRFFYRQILEGVAYMHSLNIMHRSIAIKDLKPENILVSCHNAVKIADFGQACLYYPNDDNREYEENVATRWYRAPELLFGCRRYTPSVDVWAIGCVLAEFFICSPLFSGRSDIEQISRVFALLGTPATTNWPSWKEMPDAGKLVFEESAPVEDWRTVIRGASPQVLEFLMCHLCLESRQRWTADSLLKHNYISNTCCDNRIEKLRFRPTKRERDKSEPRRPMPLLMKRHFY